MKSVLQHPALARGRPPDACILDLGPPGLARLGPAWDQELEEFLKGFVAHHPETPVLAVTQDLYVHRRCTHLLEKVGLTERTSASDARRSRIVVRSSDDCFTADPDIGEVSEVEFNFHSAGGRGTAALRLLSDAARQSSDPTAGGLPRHAMGSVRRAMSFPCGLSVAHETLSETDAGASTFLERRSASTVLAVIKRQLELSVDSAERQKLIEAERAVDAAFTEFEEDTPIGSMLAEIAGTVSRKSSPSVIAFSSDYELLLGERRICTDDEQGEHIKRRIASDFIRLSTLQVSSRTMPSFRKRVRCFPSGFWRKHVCKFITQQLRPRFQAFPGIGFETARAAPRLCSFIATSWMKRTPTPERPLSDEICSGTTSQSLCRSPFEWVREGASMFVRLSSNVFRGGRSQFRLG